MRPAKARAFAIVQARPEFILAFAFCCGAPLRDRRLAHGVGTVVQALHVLRRERNGGSARRGHSGGFRGIMLPSESWNNASTRTFTCNCTLVAQYRSSTPTIDKLICRTIRLAGRARDQQGVVVLTRQVSLTVAETQQDGPPRRVLVHLLSVIELLCPSSLW